MKPEFVQPPLCKSCKHARRSYFPAFWNPMHFSKCAHPTSASDESLVWGGGGSYCSVMRGSMVPERCGTAGQHFEPR